MASNKNSRIANWLRSSRWNILAAGILAVGLISAVAIFAAEPETGVVGTSASCPEAVVDWADENGWTDPNSYTCNVDPNKGVVDPQAGAIAPEQFANIDTEAELTEYLNSDDPEAALIRQQARDNMTDDEYTAWINGSFVAVQFLQEAEVVGAAVNDDGTIRYPTEPRYVPTGDVTFVFVDPNDGEEIAVGAGVANAQQKKQKKPAAKGNVTKANSGKASQEAKKKTKKNNKKPAATGGVKPPANNPAQKPNTKKKKGKVKTQGNIRKDCGNINANIKNPGKTGYLRVIKFNDKNGNGKQDPDELWNNAENGQVQFKVSGKHNGKNVNLGPYTAKVRPIGNGQTDILIEGLPVGKWTVTEIFSDPQWKSTTAGGKTQVADVKDRTSLCGADSQKRCDIILFGNQRQPGAQTATPVPSGTPTTPPSGTPTPTTPPSGTPGPQGTSEPTDAPPGGPDTPQAPSGEVKGTLPSTGTSGTIALITILAAIAAYGIGRYVISKNKTGKAKRK